MTQVLITSSVLILVMALARLVLRKRVSQRLIYGLWLLVALRLLIPVQFGQSQYSVTTVTQSATNQVQQAVSRPISGPSREEVYDQLVEDYLAQTPQSPDTPEVPVSPTAPEVTATAPTVPAQVQTQLRQEAEAQVTAPSMAEILTGIWIAGMTAMALWFLTANLLFMRKIRKNSEVWEGETTARVRICPHLDTPCLVGIFRPTVCLTPASIENEDTLRHVLAHETTHLRHGDHIWSLVRCICLCIYWFNPLVWLAVILSKRDQELACDEAALQKLGEEERIPYGKTLLTIVSHSVTPGKFLQTATAMSETKKQLKERIEFIVKRPKNFWLAAISLILIAALTTGIVFTGCKIDEKNILAATESTEPSIELPDTYYYNDILLDYQKLIDFRLSDTFDTDWANGSYIEESEALTNAKWDDYDDRKTNQNKLSDKWNNMLAHMTDGLENATADSFGYVVRDINGDARPELFWIREDWTLLAVFTQVDDYAVLMDAFWPDYQGVITDNGTLYTGYHRNDRYFNDIMSIGITGTLIRKESFSIFDMSEETPSYIYHNYETDTDDVSEEKYREALAANPFQWGESWAGVTPEPAAEYESIDIEVPPVSTDSLVYLPVEIVYNGSSGRVFRTTCGYDHRGLLTSIEVHNADELIEANYYTYNDRGMIVKEIWRDPPLEDRITEYSYTYNKNGSVASVVHVFDGREGYTRKYLYRGDDGRLLKVEFWTEGQLTNSYTLSYDVSGRDNLTNYVYTPHLSSNPWDERRVVLYYDEKNRISNGLKYNHKNEVVQKEANGLIYSYIGSTLVDLRANPYTDSNYTYELNEHGKVIRKTYRGEDDTTSYTTYRYEAFSVDASLCEKMLPWDDAMVGRDDMDILDFYEDPMWLLIPRPADMSHLM